MKILFFLKKSVLDLFFPKFCFSCREEGSYLCQDCLSTLEILEYQYCLCKKPLRLVLAGKCRSCYYKKLNGLYFALPYQNQLLRKLIHKFKYEPYVKELAELLSSLIISHFKLSNKPPRFGLDWVFIPIPLSIKREKKRGFNQAKEIAKELSKKLNLPLADDILLKIKETFPQVELEEEARIENIKESFAASRKLNGKKILLIDDVYTTGATMEECAKTLKVAGAKEIWGVVVARG
ncbi:MAG TPA: ComF family protein [Candidatus Nealsonbacteria bacterium]|uniref:Phosphoribosyltransferase domain-containing protein n=1 Tax=marine sediment metagenome TaxID=412755 RepID=A0A0F9UWD2_9ZZZZ|nr:ComF family protein [Candidatus Nealsonbacteria bacterium]HEB46158.1 ComF family protein [Candidatus Nealsonbacteria bacterium]